MWARPNVPNIKGMLASRIPSNACDISVAIGSRLVSRIISSQTPIYPVYKILIVVVLGKVVSWL